MVFLGGRLCLNVFSFSYFFLERRFMFEREVVWVFMIISRLVDCLVNWNGREGGILFLRFEF